MAEKADLHPHPTYIVMLNLPAPAKAGVAASTGSLALSRRLLLDGGALRCRPAQMAWWMLNRVQHDGEDNGGPSADRRTAGTGELGRARAGVRSGCPAGARRAGLACHRHRS